MHCRWRPGTIPFQSAAAPSSLAIVAAVPSRPRYLGSAAGAVASPTTVFCSWRRTLAVSRGMVHICSEKSRIESSAA